MDILSTSGLSSSTNAMYANQASNAKEVAGLQKSLAIQQAQSVTASSSAEPPASERRGLAGNVGLSINITA